jgi:AcrR family transcriptional regulator
MARTTRNERALQAPAAPKRMRSLDRRRQIVRVASRLLAARGVDHVRMPEVAEVAGVTRAVVYRFFPSRQALLAAVLDDFRRELEARFEARRGLLRGTNLDSTVRGFVEAICEAIDASGAGGFILLNMDGPDPELGRLSRETRVALNRPWLARVGHVTGGGDRLVTVVSEIALATSRAVLGLYIEQRLTRDEAVEALSRAVRALLAEFAKRGSSGP